MKYRNGPFSIILRSLAVCLAFFYACPVFAQEWLRDRRILEGLGIKVGNFELHPGIGAEFGYNSNWFLRSSGTGFLNSAPAAPVRESLMLRLTPSITLSNYGDRIQAEASGRPFAPPPVTFRLSASLTYREFFGVQEIRDERNVSGSVDAHVDLFPARPVGFALIGGFNRLIRPNSGADLNSSFDQNNPYGGAELVLKPFGGLFDIRAGYMFRAIFFQDDVSKNYDNFTHEIAVRSNWQFRPRTSLFHETTLGFLNYRNPGGTESLVTNSTPLRTRIGINGLVTARLAALAAVGYGASFYSGAAKTAQQYDSVIGQLELRWYFGRSVSLKSVDVVPPGASHLAAGYIREYQNNYVGDYVGINRGYVNFSLFLAEKIVASVRADLSGRSTPTVYLRNGSVASSPYTVIRPSITAHGEYRFASQLALTLMAQYEQDVTDAKLVFTSGVQDLSRKQFQAFLGVRWFL